MSMLRRGADGWAAEIHSRLAPLAVSTKVALLLTRLRGYGFFRKLPVNEMWWATSVARRVRHSIPLILGPRGPASEASSRVRSCGGSNGKCIVFSNFIEAIDSVANTISEALHGQGIFMRFTANMKGGLKERIAALQLFRDDPSISVLLLDGVGKSCLEFVGVDAVSARETTPALREPFGWSIGNDSGRSADLLACAGCKPHVVSCAPRRTACAIS